MEIKIEKPAFASNLINMKMHILHLEKYTLKYEYALHESVRTWSFSGPYFPAFGSNTERHGVSLHFSPNAGKTDQKNSEYGHFSRNNGNINILKISSGGELRKKDNI